MILRPFILQGSETTLLYLESGTLDHLATLTAPLKQPYYETLNICTPFTASREVVVMLGCPVDTTYYVECQISVLE